MSFDGAGDVNVFLSSPRVGFGEPPPTTATSLLTFADMVLALDHKHIVESVKHPSAFVEIKSENDHTYASSGSSRTTRSQTAKAAAQLTSRLSKDDNLKIKEEYISNLSTISSESNPGSPSVSTDQKYFNSTEDLHLKSKRSSSVENIHYANAQLYTNKTCEWPHDVSKSSPRKSCSFEEVNCDSGKSCMKSCKSSENIQRTGVSHTLHRFVNNTLEFPCWPRKADHTYATATWDGTAASHSLFEQELQQDPPKSNLVEDQEMRDADVDDPSLIQNNNGFSDTSSVHHFQVFPQKDDHTYVKSKSSPVSSPGTIDVDILSSFGADKQCYSSATFPRQKMREDHTYFHTGFSRKNNGGTVGREWASTQTVGSATFQQDMQIEEAYRNVHSFSHSASAKKDHTYSTSA